jgi:DNA repair protein RadD
VTDVLRPYQTDVVAQIEQAVAAGEKRLLVVAPTGSGKTVVGAEVIADYMQRYQPVVVLAHRK